MTSMLIDANNDNNPLQTNCSLAMLDTLGVISTVTSTGMDIFPVHLDRHLGHGLSCHRQRRYITRRDTPVVMKKIKTKETSDFKIIV